MTAGSYRPGPFFDRLRSHGRPFLLSALIGGFALAVVATSALLFWVFGATMWAVVAGNFATYVAGTVGRWVLHLVSLRLGLAAEAETE